MSPKNKKELILIRKKLDSLDNKLIELIKKRTKLVDKKRISNILKGVRQKSIRKNIDPKITHRIWKNMIWSYINYERKIFKKK